MRVDVAPQKGFSLLEVMIALLVLCFGLLGLLRLQGLAQQQLFDAAQRSLATRLARDVLARLHSNPAALAHYASLSPIAAGSFAPQAGGIEGAATPCTQADCRPVERADADAAFWRGVLAGRAPLASGPRADGGLVRGVVCIQRQAGGVAVEVAWRASVAAVAGAGAGAVGTGAGAAACGAGSGGFGEAGELRRALRMVSYVSGA